jgi:hypothetical protein
MPTVFDKQDTLQCFGTECSNAPAYRFISLSGDAVIEGERVGGIGVSLLCKGCLVREHSFKDLGEPIYYGENRVLGPGDISFVVLPLHLTKQQVAQLRQEITEDVPVSSTV